MKVYTRTGDAGTTSLIGGVRAPKHHPRIEAYGTIDELQANLAVLFDHSPEKHPARDIILWLQERLMTVSAILAAEGDVHKKLPKISQEDIQKIEAEIDKITDKLPKISSFTLFGGCLEASYCHLCRTICRRAERNISYLIDNDFFVPQEVSQFINRLSDLLYVMARQFFIDTDKQEILWKPATD